MTRGPATRVPAGAAAAVPPHAGRGDPETDAALDRQKLGPVKLSAFVASPEGKRPLPAWRALTRGEGSGCVCRNSRVNG